MVKRKIDRDLLLIGLLVAESIIAIGIALSDNTVAVITIITVLLATAIVTWILWR